MDRSIHVFSWLNSVLLLLLTQALLAAPVGPMNYQGRLLDDQGVPVTGNYDFVVRIYDDESAGTLQYRETHTDVNVNDGVYAFKVGTQTPDVGTWDLDLWQNNLNNLYLELQVGTGPGEILSPRHELTSAPHAFTATLALSADTLGAKTAAQYDNILEGICISSKGKWLALLEKCLGIGATVTLSAWDLMDDGADSTDYSNLDLTDANLDGTWFNCATGAAGCPPEPIDFSGTLFKNTTIHMRRLGGIDGSVNDFTGAVFDGAILTNGISNPPYINLTNATIKNMDLSNLDLSNAILDGLSAAELSGCPAALPALWACLEQFPSSGRYYLIGPGANLSAGSAITSERFGVSYLNLHQAALSQYNPGGAVTGINFEGTYITQDFPASLTLDNANFSYATMNGITFANDFTGGQAFINATLKNVEFQATVSVVDGLSFKNSTLDDVRFSFTIDRDPLDGHALNFINAKLTNIRVTQNYSLTAGSTCNFSNAVITNLADNKSTANGGLMTCGSGFFTETFFYGFLFAKGAGGVDFTGARFWGGHLKGDFTSTTLDTTSFIGVNLLGADFTSATGSNSTKAGVVWYGAICPDGYQIATLTENCVSHSWPAPN